MSSSAAAAVGAGSVFTVLLVWFILQAFATWKIFAKAGKPGWHSFIPILNIIDEYDLSWNATMGCVFLAGTFFGNMLRNMPEKGSFVSLLASLIPFCVFVIHCIQSFKLAKSFGKGTLYGIFLLLFGPLARVILGWSGAQYLGKE